MFIGLDIRTVHCFEHKNCPLVWAKELSIGLGKELSIGLGKRTVHWSEHKNCSKIWAKKNVHWSEQKTVHRS